MNDDVILLERSIPASAREADRLCAALGDILRARLLGGAAAKRVFGAELVAREAIQNSVDYGCAAIASKEVAVSLRLSGDRLVLTVADEGPGFDVEGVSASELNSSPGVSGNGIRIIAAYTDGFHYEDDGRKLVAEFVVGKENVMQDLQSNEVWAPKTDLVAANAQSAKEELRELVARSAGELVVDLSSVAMIDSKGLGILIAAVNSLEAAGRKLRVTGANPDLVELFKLMRLDRHLTIA